jgi:hypothetical protein
MLELYTLSALTAWQSSLDSDKPEQFVMQLYEVRCMKLGASFKISPVAPMNADETARSHRDKAA